MRGCTKRFRACSPLLASSVPPALVRRSTAKSMRARRRKSTWIFKYLSRTAAVLQALGYRYGARRWLAYRVCFLYWSLTAFWFPMSCTRRRVLKRQSELPLHCWVKASYPAAVEAPKQPTPARLMRCCIKAVVSFDTRYRFRYGGFHKCGAPKQTQIYYGPHYRDYQNGAPNFWKQPYRHILSLTGGAAEHVLWPEGSPQKVLPDSLFCPKPILWAPDSESL